MTENLMIVVETAVASAVPLEAVLAAAGVTRTFQSVGHHLTHGRSGNPCCLTLGMSETLEIPEIQGKHDLKVAEIPGTQEIQGRSGTEDLMVEIHEIYAWSLLSWTILPLPGAWTRETLGIGMSCPCLSFPLPITERTGSLRNVVEVQVQEEILTQWNVIACIQGTCTIHATDLGTAFHLMRTLGDL